MQQTNICLIAMKDHMVRVSSGGDVNGDGIADFIINFEGRTSSPSYVVFGRTGLSSIDLESLTAVQGFKISGDNASYLNYVSIVGDINNDGIDDIAVSQSYYSNGLKYRTYFLYGKNRFYRCCV